MKSVILLVGGSSTIGNSIATEISKFSNLEIIRTIRDPKRVAFETEFFDFSSDESIKSNMQNLFQKFSISYVIISIGKMESHSNKDDLDILKTNFEIPLSVFNSILNHRNSKNHTTIIYVSSALVNLRPQKSNTAYYASKNGMDFFARGVLESIDKTSKLSLLILRPGYVASPMNAFQKSKAISSNLDRMSNLVVKKIHLHKSGIIYYPRIYKYLVFVLNLLPKKIYQILNDYLRR